MSANDFGRLTAKEFLAQLKQNLEFRLNNLSPYRKDILKNQGCGILLS